MPKEQITRFTAPDPEDGFVHPELVVHWGKDTNGHVQIELNIDADDLRERAKDEDVIACGFFSDGLTIQQINKLIKTLMRAKEHRLAQSAWDQRWISEPEAGVTEWKAV